MPNLFNVCLHLEWCSELLVASAALCQVGQIKILLLLGIHVTLNVRHHADVVVQHLVAVPALKQKK